MSETESGDEPFPAARCGDCGTVYGHPPAACRDCGSKSVEPIELAGHGQLYASTVIRVPGVDNQGEAPYRVGLVDVGEGDAVRVTARLESERDLSPGQPVEFVGRRDGAFVFRPA